VKVSKVFLSGLFIASSFVSATSNHGVYYSELKAFKKAAATKEMFDEDAHPELARIQRDTLICSNLTFIQRFVRSGLFELDLVLVTPHTLPKLYEYVDGVCKKAHIVTPTIFITRDKYGFFNAFAEKLLMSTGAIVIGQKLMRETSDNALEAVLAHEVGHIKYNHGNKKLALGLGSLLLYLILFKLLLDKDFTKIKQQINDIFSNHRVTSEDVVELMRKVQTFQVKRKLLSFGISLVPAFIINKRFEKEADEFACKDNGKSKGLIEFCELILQKEELREEEFATIYKLLQDNKADLSFISYYFNLIIRYYSSRIGHLYNNIREYVYHHTFLGAYPSPEARIEAAKKYLQQEA
jgi:Zn-dependent protease with chaperone function